MARAPAMQVGKKKCPRCAETVKAEATACRHCSYEFTAEEMKRQVDFEAANRRRGSIGCVAILIAALVFYVWYHNRPVRPLTPAEAAAEREANAKDKEDVAKFDAEGTAAEAVKARMKNPSSFELVGAKAMRGKTDDGSPGWIVGVTYRGTNSLGGVVTQNAIVSVDDVGTSALKVIDIN